MTDARSNIQAQESSLSTGRGSTELNEKLIEVFGKEKAGWFRASYDISHKFAYDEEIKPISNDALYIKELDHKADGLKVYAIWKKNPDLKPEINICFRGTACFDSGVRDADPRGPGHATFDQVCDTLLNQINILIELYLASTKKENEIPQPTVAINIFGHSLGGADAQKLLMAILHAKASYLATQSNANREQFKKINLLRLLAICAPGIQSGQNEDELCAKIMEHERLTIECYRVINEHDIVPQFSTALFANTKNQNITQGFIYTRPKQQPTSTLDAAIDAHTKDIMNTSSDIAEFTICTNKEKDGQDFMQQKLTEKTSVISKLADTIFGAAVKWSLYLGGSMLSKIKKLFSRKNKEKPLTLSDLVNDDTHEVAFDEAGTEGDWSDVRLTKKTNSNPPSPVEMKKVEPNLPLPTVATLPQLVQLNHDSSLEAPLHADFSEPLDVIFHDAPDESNLPAPVNVLLQTKEESPQSSTMNSHVDTSTQSIAVPLKEFKDFPTEGTSSGLLLSTFGTFSQPSVLAFSQMTASVAPANDTPVDAAPKVTSVLPDKLLNAATHFIEMLLDENFWKTTCRIGIPDGVRAMKHSVSEKDTVESLQQKFTQLQTIANVRLEKKSCLSSLYSCFGRKYEPRHAVTKTLYEAFRDSQSIKTFFEDNRFRQLIHDWNRFHERYDRSFVI